MARTWVATADDARAVAGLLIAFRDHQGRDWPADDVFHQYARARLADPDTEFLLGAVGGEAEAITQLRFRPGVWRAGADCLVEDVFVAEHARRTGLGRAIMQFALERARARGAKRLELDVNEDNEPALSLYRSLGFSERHSPAYGRDLYMRLHLD